MDERYPAQPRRDRDPENYDYAPSRPSKPRTRSQVRIQVPESLAGDGPREDSSRRRARFGGEPRPLDEDPASSDRPELRRRKSVDLEKKTSKEDEEFRRRRDALEAQEAKLMRRSEDLPRPYGGRGDRREDGGRYDEREMGGERRRPRDDDIESGRDIERRRTRDGDESASIVERRRTRDGDESGRDGERRHHHDDGESRKHGERRRHHHDGDSGKHGEKRHHGDGERRTDDDRKGPRSDDESRRRHHHHHAEGYPKRTEPLPAEIPEDTVSYGSGPVDQYGLYNRPSDRYRDGPGSIIGLPRASRDPRDRDDRDDRGGRSVRGEKIDRGDRRDRGDRYERDPRDSESVASDGSSSRRADRSAIAPEDVLGGRPDGRDRQDYDSRRLAERPAKYISSKENMDDPKERDNPPRAERRRDPRSEY